MKRALWLSLLLWIGQTRPAGAEDKPFTAPADWKTYTNAAYGFQFKYPPQFQLRERYKFKTPGVFSAKINSSLFSVTLLAKGDYAGFSVVVEKKDKLFFRSRALPGFYKYDTALNTWLGYNPIVMEYGHSQKMYFYLAPVLCAQEETVGPDMIPAYGTTNLVGPSEPHNDMVLTDHDFGFEIPREDTMIPSPTHEPLMDVLDKIRDTFQCLEPVKALKANCTVAVLNVSGMTVPQLAEPPHGQTILCRKPVRVALTRPLPPGIGVVFYLTAAETADADKIVYESPVGDIASGKQGTLRCQDVPLAPGETGATPMSLHVLYYKVVHGRKVLLGEDFHQIVSLMVK